MHVKSNIFLEIKLQIRIIYHLFCLKPKIILRAELSSDSSPKVRLMVIDIKHILLSWY